MVRHQRGSISVPAPAERPTSAQAVGHGGPGPPPLPSGEENGILERAEGGEEAGGPCSERDGLLQPAQKWP